MPSSVAGTTEAPKASQVQENQSTPKVSRQNRSGSAANPQDTVTISAQARAAQQQSQSKQNPADAHQRHSNK